jgi:hypothetical protein
MCLHGAARYGVGGWCTSDTTVLSLDQFRNCLVGMLGYAHNSQSSTLTVSSKTSSDTVSPPVPRCDVQYILVPSKGSRYIFRCLRLVPKGYGGLSFGEDGRGIGLAHARPGGVTRQRVLHAADSTVNSHS